MLQWLTLRRRLLGSEFLDKMSRKWWSGCLLFFGLMAPTKRLVP
jgi:hypothetical protein